MDYYFVWYTEIRCTKKVHPADKFEVYPWVAFQDSSSIHFVQQCLQIKWLHHGTYCKNTGEKRENPYAKKCFAGYLCSRPGVSLLVKQRAMNEINPVRPSHLAFCSLHKMPSLQVTARQFPVSWRIFLHSGYGSQVSLDVYPTGGNVFHCFLHCCSALDWNKLLSPG